MTPIPSVTLRQLGRMSGRQGLWRMPALTLLICDGHLYLKGHHVAEGSIKEHFQAVPFVIEDGEPKQQPPCVWTEVMRKDEVERVMGGYGAVQAIAEHPHVARCHHLSSPVLIQPCLPRALHEVRLPMRELLQVMGQVASGLGHLHVNGIVHRDVKPENVLMTEGGVWQLGDHDFATPEKTPAHFGCTPRYAAPEVLRRQEPQTSADVWSFAVTLYNVAALAAGEEGCPLPPLVKQACDRNADRSPDLERLAADLCDGPRDVPMPKGTEKMRALVEAALAVDGAERPTAPEMQTALEGADG